MELKVFFSHRNESPEVNLYFHEPFAKSAEVCSSGKHAQGKFFYTARHEESTISFEYGALSPGNENPFKMGKLICHSLEIIEGYPAEERQMNER